MKMLKVEVQHLITNGIPTSDTLDGIRACGFTVMRTIPLNVMHEDYFGAETDCITFYARVDTKNVGSNYE